MKNKFVNGVGYGVGYGDGYGSGYGDGSGSSEGFGLGDGSGLGYGSGSGSGYKTQALISNQPAPEMRYYRPRTEAIGAKGIRGII